MPCSALSITPSPSPLPTPSPSPLLFACDRRMSRRLPISCLSDVARSFAGADWDIIEGGARWNNQLLQLLLERSIGNDVLVQTRANRWRHRHKRVWVIIVVSIAKCEVISLPPLLPMLFRGEQCDRNTGYLLCWQSDGSTACDCAIACPTAANADWRRRGEGSGRGWRGGRLTA